MWGMGCLDKTVSLGLQTGRALTCGRVRYKKNQGDVPRGLTDQINN